MSALPKIVKGTLPSASYLVRCTPSGLLGYGTAASMSPYRHMFRRRNHGSSVHLGCKDLTIKARKKKPKAKYIAVFNMFDNDSRFVRSPYFVRMYQNTKGRHWHALKTRIGEPLSNHNWYYLVPALRKYGQLSLNAISHGFYKPQEEMTDAEVMKWMIFPKRTSFRCKLVAYARTEKAIINS